MTQTERIANLMAQNAILRDEKAVKERIAQQENDELLELIAESVDNIYNSDMEEIENV